MPSPRALGLVLVAALSSGACSYRVELQPAPAQAESTRILAADGSALAALHGTEDREHVPLGKVSTRLQDAVVAIEDARFFSHRGVDPKAVLRAGSRNALQGRVAEGGSTITQQYVKNALLGPERTVGRKVREASLAYQLERRHSKLTILERYLNTIYLGNGAYGIQAAAALYFDKPAANLDLAESSLLAGLIRAPERYDPYDHPERALERRAVVLGRLVELGKAEANEAEAAKAAPLSLAPPRRTRYEAGHFVELVKRSLLADDRLGQTREARRRRLFQGGLRVATTIDPRLQRLAEEAVHGVLPDSTSGPSAALVALDPATGAIRALVGGPDFFGDDKTARFDLATQGRRQTGSAFK
ncbi:MAG: transglycosylase domain-containing protein, partial [Acidimicrobiia bacterium]